MIQQSERRKRCQIAVYKRDTYRRTGRGRFGFSMHYNKEQCARAAVENGVCRQHLKCAWVDNAERLTWHEFIEERG